MKKILITGAFGQLGTSLCKVLSNESILASGRVIISTKKYKCIELDITNQKRVAEIIRDYKPDIIIHCAAIVGGILFNQQNQIKMLYENIEINNNLINAAYENNTQLAK